MESVVYRVRVDMSTKQGIKDSSSVFFLLYCKLSFITLISHLSHFPIPFLSLCSIIQSVVGCVKCQRQRSEAVIGVPFSLCGDVRAARHRLNSDRDRRAEGTTWQLGLANRTTPQRQACEL